MAKNKRPKANIGQLIFALIAVLVIVTMILGAVISY